MRKTKQTKDQPQVKVKKQAKKEQKSAIIKTAEKPPSGDRYDLPFTD